MSNWYKSPEEIKLENRVKSDMMDKYPHLYYYHRRPNNRKHSMGYGLDIKLGWLNLIEEMSAKVEKIINEKLKADPDYNFPKAVQVKEKFGTLCFYVSHSDEEINKIIREYESKSATVCENCGNNGESRGGGWVKVLCDSCNEIRNK